MTDETTFLITGLTRVQRDIYEVVKLAAEAGEPCPTNLALATQTDLSIETASRNLHALADVGLIEIDGSHPRYRVVTVHETGKSTRAAPPPPKKAGPSAFHQTPEGAALRLERALNKERDADARRVQRDPCFMCGTPYDRHEQFGCRKWRPRG